MKLFDFNDISFPGHYLSLQNSGPCNSFYCLGHFKNVYDDDDDDDDVIGGTLHCGRIDYWTR